MLNLRLPAVAAWFAVAALAVVPRAGLAQSGDRKPRPDARFGNFLFKTPDPSVWTRQERDGHLLFVAGANGKDDYCVLTLYPGDTAADDFRNQFNDAVAAKLKNRGVVGRMVADSGALPHRAAEGFDVLTRTIRGTTRHGEADHVYVAGRFQDRFELAAFQASSPALYARHSAAATEFLDSLKLINALTPRQVDRLLSGRGDDWRRDADVPRVDRPTADPADPPDPWPGEAPRPDSRFGNWLFRAPPLATWRRSERGDQLLFDADAPGRDGYCDLILYAGNAAAEDFKRQFAEAVDGHLRNRRVGRVLADSGAVPHRTADGSRVLVRVVRGETATGEADHIYAGVQCRDRFELAAFQASSGELFNRHKDEAVRFLQSARAINTLTPGEVDRLLN